MARKSGFSGFKWSRKGYQAVVDSAPVQSRIREYAESAAGGASARVNAHDHEGEHFAVKQVQGRFSKGCIVHPTTNNGAAHADEALGQFGG